MTREAVLNGERVNGKSHTNGASNNDINFRGKSGVGEPYVEATDGSIGASLIGNGGSNINSVETSGGLLGSPPVLPNKYGAKNLNAILRNTNI